MTRAPLLLFALLLIFVDEVNSSTPFTSALTVNFSCGTIPTQDIVVNIVAQNNQAREVRIKTEGKKKFEVIELPASSLGQSATFKYQFNQTSLKKVTLSSSASHICVNALVVNTVVVVDQPTDFKTTCPEETNDDIPDRPCKRLGSPIDMSRVFICPQRLKDLLLKKSLISRDPTTEPERGEPPIYDTTGDNVQASLAIVAGISAYGGAITKARRKYKAGRSVDPLRTLSKIGSFFQTAASFFNVLAPAFSVFSGVASILTTYLTPNPFDEIAKYLDRQFKQVNDQLFDIQTDIADLGRLIEAKSGVLGMTKQIRALRHSARNYGAMMTALSTRPICGAKESFQMKEVSEFMRQYEADGVDNCLLDLYGVEFGELAEATSLLRPYMLAYCHNKPHLVQKFAEELIYYGYAGLQSHFAYHSLIAAFKGGDFQADEAWLTKLYKFAKKASVFKEASKTPPTESSRTNSLQFDLEDEILMKVRQNESTVIDWLKKRIINENDWPYQCLMKEANGTEKNNTLLMLHIKVTSSNTDVLNAFLCPENYSREPKHYYISPTHGYFRASRKTPIKEKANTTNPKPKHNLIVVFYCADRNTCRQQRHVVVSWSMAYLYCNTKMGQYSDHFYISKDEVFIPKEWLPGNCTSK